jgi:hypothetical protein
VTSVQLEAFLLEVIVRPGAGAGAEENVGGGKPLPDV